MFITRLSVFRPVLMLMVILTFVVLGFYSFLDLAIDLFPQVDFPFVTVRTVYLGAGPAEIEKPHNASYRRRGERYKRGEKYYLNICRGRFGRCN